MQKILFHCFGRRVGLIARYWVGSTVAGRLGTRFPYGTFVINITACVLLGFAMTYLGKRTGLNPSWRFFVPIGFIGAYSTFSTYEWETFSTLRSGAFFMAPVYAVSSLSWAWPRSGPAHDAGGRHLVTSAGLSRQDGDHAASGQGDEGVDLS